MTTVAGDGLASELAGVTHPGLGDDPGIDAAEYARIMRRISKPDSGVCAFNSSI